MDHQKIFPTHLFLIDDFYNSDITAMKKYISDLFSALVDQIKFQDFVLCQLS